MNFREVLSNRLRIERIHASRRRKEREPRRFYRQYQRASGHESRNRTTDSSAHFTND